MTTIQDDKEFMDKLIDVKEKSKGRKEESRCFTENGSSSWGEVWQIN